MVGALSLWLLARLWKGSCGDTHFIPPQFVWQSILANVAVGLCEFLRTVFYGQAGVAAQLCPKCICAEALKCLAVAWTAEEASG